MRVDKPFVYLKGELIRRKLALSGILGFVGVKMLLAGAYRFSIVRSISCAIRPFVYPPSAMH